MKKILKKCFRIIRITKDKKFTKIFTKYFRKMSDETSTLFIQLIGTLSHPGLKNMSHRIKEVMTRRGQTPQTRRSPRSHKKHQIWSKMGRLVLKMGHLVRKVGPLIRKVGPPKG